MATYRKRGKSWLIRWRELEVIQEEDGSQTRVWRGRGYTVPTESAAKKLVPVIEETVKLHGRWTPEQERATVTMGTIGQAYVAAAVDAGAPLATQRFRSTMISAWYKFVGEEEPATSLSLTLLGNYAASLPSEGRKAHTRHRKLAEVERMWTWAHERPEQFPGVPLPRKLTGKDADRIKPPPPVVAVAAPEWGDVDAMIAQLTRRRWHRQLATFLRFTGLRVSQALGLDWQDVHLDREQPYMLVRAGTAGAKRGRARALPIHSALAAEMAGWGVREGLVFRRPDGRPWRGDAPVEPFRRAWKLSQVATRKWGASDRANGLPGDRAHARPTHAFRACVVAGLRREGVQEQYVLYLTGHAQGGTIAAYVPEGSPEDSPYWTHLVAAIKKIPAMSDSSQVLRLTSEQP